MPPKYDDLASADPPYSSWEYFGREDQRGTINFLTPERVAAAARLVRTGKQIGLDYPVNAFEPYPTGTRPATRHHVFANNEFHRDDWIDSFYLQSTSQVDSLRHIGHPAHGFYNGRSPSQNDAGSTDLGIHVWASTGIAGRGCCWTSSGTSPGPATTTRRRSPSTSRRSTRSPTRRA